MHLSKQLSVFAVITAMCISHLHAQNSTIDDTQIIDQLKEPVRILSQQDLKLSQTTSCDALETTLESYVNKHRNSYWYYGIESDAMIKRLDFPVSSTPTPNTSKETAESSNVIDVSKTNIQKIWVDEPEILKIKEGYLAYYSQEQQAIMIINHAGVSQGNEPQLIKKIKLPKSFGNIQLFIHQEQLVILANRYLEQPSGKNILDNSSRTTLIVYDMSTLASPRLIKLVDTQGYMMEARLINGTLYLVNRIDMNRYPLWERSTDKPLDLSIKEFMPTTIAIWEKDSRARSISQRYNIATSKPSCNEISYHFPSTGSEQQYSQSPSFTALHRIDLNSKTTDVSTHIVIGQAWQIHVSTDHLYLVTPYRTPAGRRSCPMGARCTAPYFENQEQTLINKFSLGSSMPWSRINYVSSNIIPGSLLTQYSMDEDDQGYFRILTSQRSSESTTHLYILNKDLSIAGSLTNIEPGEQFKASRYIGKYLYLVTFRQIDPLFVIDMSDVSKPSIKGKLKIPGYSTYLHPLAGSSASSQLLVGLGYDVQPSQWGWSRNGGIQIATFKIDFDTKASVDDTCGRIKDLKEEYEECVKSFDPSMIRVQGLDSVTLGQAGSYSESLYNPRMFVIDANNTLSLPMVLQQEQVIGEYCAIDATASWGKICTPQYSSVAGFAGIKSFEISNAGMIKESYSKDYRNTPKSEVSNTLESSISYYDPSRSIMNSARVGFIGTQLLFINNHFADYIDTKGKGTMIPFSSQ